MSERYLLRDLIIETRDGDWGKDEAKDGYVPYRVIRGGDFTEVELGNIKKVPRCYLKESTVKRRTLESGDLLIETAGGTKKRPTGRVLYISQELLNKFDLPVTCASFARFIRVDYKKINPEYLFWYLRSIYQRGEMWQHQVQHTGIARFQWTKFADSLVIKLPKRSVQDKVVKILGSVDKKIQLNHQVNQTLNQINQAIYKSWFVNFEPVKAKIQAKQNGQDPEHAAMCAISGKTIEELDQLGASQLEQLAIVAALFPGEIQKSAHGDYPKGWVATKYTDLYTEKKEKVKKREDVSVLSAVQTGELKSPADVFGKQVHSKDISKYKLVGVGDLAYNPSRINIGSAGFNEFDFCGAVSPVYTVMGLKDQAYGVFARMHLKLRLTKEWISILCSGSVRQSLSVDDFLSIPVVLPGNDLIEEFSKIYKYFEKQIKANNEENIILESIRDSLLPKLLSGEISIGDIKSKSEAVA